MTTAEQLAAACRQGKLVITTGSVSLTPRRTLRNRPGWMVERERVVGVSIARKPRSVCLRICTDDGISHLVDPLISSDALRVVDLLGYAPGVSPVLSMHSLMDRPVKMPCAWGHAELTDTQLTFRPLLPWHRERSWSVVLDDIVGASNTTPPGTRMLHDLAIHTTGGQVYVLRRLRPQHALALTQRCGHMYAALPAEPKSQREALEYHITTKSRSIAASGPLAIEPARRQAKPRRVQRELDDFWNQQRRSTDRFRPLADA